MNNMDIRKVIEDRRLKYWEVAKALGIHEATLSRWLRHELDNDKKKQVLDAIQTIK